MSIETFISFNILLGAALISPGPAFIIALHTTVAAGARAGIAVGLGLAFMAACWTLFAALGLDLLFRLFPTGYFLLRIMGALYLLLIAWRLWRDAGSKIAERHVQAPSAFAKGILVNAANPKSVLFAGAVIASIFPGDLGLATIAAITINHFVVEAMFYSVMALVMSKPLATQTYLNTKRGIDRVSGLILGALGLRLLLTSREL